MSQTCKDYKYGICNLFCDGISEDCREEDIVRQYSQAETGLETMAEMAENVLNNQNDFYKIIDSMRNTAKFISSIRRSAIIRNKMH